MATWPSGTKASATTTAADTNSISGARSDINQAITNQNSIIDMFDIPASPTDDYILVYDSASATFKVEANTAANEVVDDTTPQLGGELDQNGYMITDASRNFQILGDQSNTTTLSGVFDTFANINRVHGVVNVNYIDGYPSNRIHSNPRLTYIKADADATPGSSSPGRIRANYVETQYDLNSYDNTTSNFGQGFNSLFVAGVAKNTAASTTSNLTEHTALTVTPQIDQAGYTSSNTIVTDMAGVEVQGYCTGSGSGATNFYGFYYNAPDGNNPTRLGLTTHYSFYGADVNATLYNEGPLKAKGLSYPTSDGTSGQVIKTDGSGNLSFTNLTTTDIYYNGGTLGSTGATTTPDYNNGNFIRYEVTRDNGVGGGVYLNAPSNMSDGNTMWLAFEATAGTAGQSAIVQWNTGQNIYDNTTTYTITSGKTLLIRVVRIAGPKYLSHNDDLYDASAI